MRECAQAPFALIFLCAGLYDSMANATCRGRRACVKNVEMSVDGQRLTITVDLSKDFGPSSTGKTIIIASTEGNITVPGREEKVGLNVYRKK